MTLGSVQPGGDMSVIVAGKDGTNPIPVGALVVRDTAASPKGYKTSPAAAAGTGPFGVCVNRAATAADRAFSMALPGTLVTVKAQGVIDVGSAVYQSVTVAGSVAGAGTGDIAGRYIGHENEMTGALPGSAAADGELIVIRLGGAF